MCKIKSLLFLLVLALLNTILYPANANSQITQRLKTAQKIVGRKGGVSARKRNVKHYPTSCFGLGLNECLVPRPVEIGRLKAKARPDTELEQFLRQQYVDNTNQNETIKYAYNQTNLNGDNVPETIVYVESSSLCGSGGCPTLVLKKENNQHKIVTEIGLTKGEMFVGETRTKGWRDLYVRVSGGGYVHGHYMLLKFDGRSYPDNPTDEPAEILPGKLKGINLFAGLANGQPNLVLK